MKYIISTLMLGIFSLYFAVTLFFNFPEDSVVIGENFKGYLKFQTFLFQKWSFFAPPPESNKRAYFEFTVDRKNGKTDVYEIELFEKFGENLKEQYLFNDVVANTDWILFNYVESITDQARTNYKLYQSKNNCQDSDSECYRKYYIEYNKKLRTTKQMKFLTAHAKALARKAKIPREAKFRLKIYELPIPRYHQRYDNVKLEAKNIFNTGFYDLSEEPVFDKELYLNLFKNHGKVKEPN
jgi:hypothetical protein